LSAVDARTESEILEHIHQFMVDKTAILITHKVSSLQQFDRIIVMEGGKIVESGTHDELMHNGKLYLEMYKRQQVRGSDNII
jgi:ATP-binding cassette subfamily B protein